LPGEVAFGSDGVLRPADDGRDDVRMGQGSGSARAIRGSVRPVGFRGDAELLQAQLPARRRRRCARPARAAEGEGTGADVPRPCRPGVERRGALGHMELARKGPDAGDRARRRPLRPAGRGGPGHVDHALVAGDAESVKMTARFYGLLTASLLALSPASLAQPTTSGSFDSNGVQIQYADRGSGEPVVLIHGFTGSYARHIESPGLMDRLEKAGYRSIAIDCRGHGQSGKPRDDSAYGMEMVADVIRLMDHLKMERAHLFGYSIGGAIVSQLLVRQPTPELTATLLG